MASRLVKQTLVSASLITIGANILSRFVGFGREVLIADYFGTSQTLDTFLIAFTIPELLTFIIFAALPTAIIPAFQTSSGDDQSAEHQVFRKGLTLFALVFGLLSTLIFLLRFQIIGWLAPGLSPERVAFGAHLLAVLSLFVLFRGLEAYFRGWLFRKKHFIAPSLSPLLMNAVVLAAIFLLQGELGIEALAYGWVFGSLALLIGNGWFCLRLINDGHQSPVPKVPISPLVKLVAAVAVVESISLCYPAIDRYLAIRYLGEGEIAALRYSLFLTQIPPGVMIATFSLASFPWIAELSAAREIERLAKLYRESLGLILFVIIPVALGMLLFAEEIIRVAFQRGAFDNVSVQLTTGPFLFYSFGLLFYSAYIYQMRYYYARRLMVRLGLILTIMVLIKIVGSMVMLTPLGHRGLAAATSLAWLTGFVIMTIDLAQTARLSAIKEMRLTIMRTFPSALLLFGYWWWMIQIWPGGPTGSFMSGALRLFFLGASGLIIYFVMSLLMKVPASIKARDTLRSRLSNRRDDR